MLRSTPASNADTANNIDVIARSSTVGPVMNIRVIPKLKDESQKSNPTKDGEPWKVLRARITLAKTMLSHFSTLCNTFKSTKDTVVVIVPAGSLACKRGDISTIVEKHALQSFSIKACSHNVGSIIASPLLRPETWHIHTNCANLIAVLHGTSHYCSCHSHECNKYSINILETIQGCAFRMNQSK